MLAERCAVDLPEAFSFFEVGSGYIVCRVLLFCVVVPPCCALECMLYALFVLTSAPETPRLAPH